MMSGVTARSEPSVNRESRARRRPSPAKLVPAEQISAKRTVVWLAPFLVGVVVLLVALPTVLNAYVDLDDGPYVLEKPASDGLTSEAVAFAFTSVRPMYWHPLAWLSHELDTELYGSSPAGHHFSSALLHALTAALLCIVLIEMGAGHVPAVFGSLLWAVHPLRVESFAWIAERKDVLCAFFFLAAVALYLKYKTSGSRRLYTGWLLCGFLALMSKPTAVSLPIILLLLDFWPPRRQASLLRLTIEKLPLLAGALAVCYLAAVGQSQAMSLTPVGSFPLRLENAALSSLRYFGKILWPVRLGCFYPFDAHLAARWGIVSALVLLVITVVMARQRKARPWLLIGWSWFVITLVPNSGIVQAGRQALADRFTELPMIGIVIVLVWAVSEWAAGSRSRGKVAVGITAVALVALAILSVRQIGYWSDSETLFERAIAVDDSAYIRDNLATKLIEEGRLNEAETNLLAAVRLAPDEYPHHNNLAVLYGKMRRPQDALAQAQIASSLAPEDPSTAETLALARLGVSDYSGALQSFDRAVELGSDSATLAPVINDTGVSLAQGGRMGEAEALFRKAIAYDPLYVDAHYNLVHDLAAMGKQVEAKQALEAAIRATGPKPEYQDFMVPAPPMPLPGRR